MWIRISGERTVLGEMYRTLGARKSIEPQEQNDINEKGTLPELPCDSAGVYFVVFLSQSSSINIWNRKIICYHIKKHNWLHYIWAESMTIVTNERETLKTLSLKIVCITMFDTEKKIYICYNQKNLKMIWRENMYNPIMSWIGCCAIKTNCHTLEFLV